MNKISVFPAIQQKIGPDIVGLYTGAADRFAEVYGHLPRPDAHELLAQRWVDVMPTTEEDFVSFYRQEPLMAEETALWHSERNGRRRSRVLHAGAIARQLGVETFAEIGFGIGTDALALMTYGFFPEWLAEINAPSMRVFARHCEHCRVFPPPAVIDLTAKTPREAVEVHGGADWLYSSDVFEHIFDLESWAAGWIQSFRLVTVYAPFANGQPQHTDYKRARFVRFMERQGFTKLRVTECAVPPMVFIREV